MPTLEQELLELKARIQDYERGIQADQILRSIAVNSPSNIMMLDLEARIQYINHTVPGITPEEMIGLSIPDIVEEQYRPGIIGAFERCARTGKPDRYETSYTSPSGDISWWDCGVGPVLRDSKVTGFVVVSTNVTEQRRKHEEQERFFNLSVDLMCVAGFDGYFKNVNQAFSDTLGYKNKELLNRPFLDFVHPDDREATQEQVVRLNQGEIVRDFSNRYRAVDGSYRLFSWRGIGDKKREVMYAVARDITETIKLEEQLQQFRKLEAIGQLAGGIAHDFNNLLGAIQGNLELAQLSPKLTQSSLANALAATERAASLTKQLLVFSRNQTIAPEVVMVVPLVKDLMDLLQRLLPENIAMTVEPDDNLPPVLADKTQLEQVIVNLCVNARDAMPAGGKLTIRIDKAEIPNASNQPTTLPAGSYLKLTVADTGNGMPPKIQAHIFEPFFTTKEVGKGSGLGLATVYAIINRHNGFIEVESEVDKGTAFFVYLPVTEQTYKESIEAGSNSTDIIGGSETILVAEDDPMVRSTLTLMLQEAGYEVIAAADGLEAIRLLQQHTDKVSLAVLDVVMPNIGGLDAAEKLRGLVPDLKIVFTSGYLQNQQDPKRLEGETFLPKAYQRKTLLNCIRKLLDSTNKK